MALRLTASGGLAIRNEALWSNDPRVDLVANDTADQFTKLQAFYDLLFSSSPRSDRVGRFIPGEYRKNGELQMKNVDGHKPVYIDGFGGNPSSDAPTVIRDMSDAGAGKFSIRQTSVLGYCDVRGINLLGSLSPVAKGSTGWAMGGWEFVTRSFVDDIGATGYFGGLAPWGDHLTFGNVNVQGNAYGLWVPPNIPTQGDNRFRKVQAGGCSLAGIGVAKSSSLAGATFEFLETSAMPIGIHRYDDGTGTSAPNWLAGVDIFDWSTEYLGTGVVYDDVGDGSGITDMTVDHGTDNWALYVVGNEWPGKTKRAAWYNSGPISNVLFVKSMPRMDATLGLPALKASGLPRVRCLRPAEEAVTGITSGGRLYEITGSSSGLRGSYVGTADADGSSLIRPYPLVGTVARGEALTNSGQWSATKWSASGNAKRFLGVALHDQTGGTIHAGCHGQWGVSVLNTSGTTIAADELIVPHSAGGFAGIGTTWPTGHPAVGRMVASTANGALGVGDFF